MADHSQQGSSELSLMRGIGLTEASIEKRRKTVGLDGDDLARIARVRAVVTENVGMLSSAFFEHLATLDEGRPLLANRDLLETARAIKREHVIGMVSGDYGPAYVEGRLRSGILFARVGLEPRVFLASFQHLMRTIGALLVRETNPADSFDAFTSLMKVATFDTGLIVDVLTYERERTIRQQSEAIRELSTPVLQFRERMLLLPIIGVIDTHRAQLITESLLRSIRANRARVVVMDVTGVATIDSKVANHLLQTVAAAKLMGAHLIVTGLSAEVAQSLVALGIELGRINTVGDLQGGVEEAEKMLGYRIVQE